MNERKSPSLDSLELKALSVPSSLRFLLGIECQVVLCVTEVGSQRLFSLYFSQFSETFCKLLSLCASRFLLSCKHFSDGSGSVLHGIAVMPLLRYADYLPGALRVNEILDCLQFIPTIKPRHRESTSASAAANHTDTESSSGELYEFEACFGDCAVEFTTDASLSDAHGRGFYQTLEYGLSLATHGHLVEIKFHRDWDPKKALWEFQEFSGWNKFDLRFYDDQRKHLGGIIVMATIQDACDLLEKYEDEDSDDEGDLLPFILRPLAPLLPVPAIEDSVLRKQREQHWDNVVAFWERFPNNKNTIVVYNLYDGATQQEILSFMEGLPIAKVSMVEDDSPTRRRRLFVTFATPQGARAALELDGRSTKGRALRVQVAPPFASESRRGRLVVDATSSPVAEASPVPKLEVQPPSSETLAHGDSKRHGANHTAALVPPPASVSPGNSAACTMPLPKPRHLNHDNTAAHGKPHSDNEAFSIQQTIPPTVMPPSSTQTDPVETVLAAVAAIPGSVSHATPKHTAPAAPILKSTSSLTTTPSACAMGSNMNAGAKEFVPNFMFKVTSPEFHTTPVTLPTYDKGRRGSGFGASQLLPPPYSASVSPKLVFTPATALTLGPEYTLPLSTSSNSLPHDAGGGVPPSYSLPPSYDDNGIEPLPPPPPYKGD